ncbi:unnamed protein product [Linum trigynum]|uniref:Helitron helicase-like domain-containing protein n=1 Tax=Linum trigynum TaxID=586398 RepID=A0AAV2F2Q5_9ROSI
MDFYSTDPAKNPLHQCIVEGLQHMFDDNNILVRTFRSARDRIQNSGVQELQLKLLAKRQINSREYDLPSANEIAALIVDETGEQSFSPDIIVQQKGSEMERISVYHPSLMALQYPILFPYGEDGWHPCISYSHSSSNISVGDKMITQCDFYAYRLQTRLQESNSLLLSGKLFQQYMVNAFALIEAERLDWMRTHQSKLRGHYYKDLLNSYLRGDSDIKLSGKPVILAASHTGSPRYKYENFQDAMAICKWIGYPDLFITFTCNSNWPEIQLMVDLIRRYSGKDPDRAYITARVFKIKLDEFMLEIREKQIFGKINEYMCAYSFVIYLLMFIHYSLTSLN